MNRADLKQLAEDRILDAEHLLAIGRWSACYYLAGYAVECGLKACIVIRVEKMGFVFPDKKFADKCWTHELSQLLDQAELKDAFFDDKAAKPLLASNWEIVKDWNETSRYATMKVIEQFKATTLFNAINHPTDGVLTWIRTRW